MEEKNNINAYGATNVAEHTDSHSNEITASILPIGKLLARDNIRIPYYQRPYKWSKQYVIGLLSDIKKATYKKDSNKDFKYRIGTIILHKTQNEDKKDVYDVVDGQQRIITFAILIKALKNLTPKLTECLHLSTFFDNYKFKSIEKDNVKTNYDIIFNFLKNLTDTEKEWFIDSLADLLQVVVIVVSSQTEAFQLFDSQNYRGKALFPHDLLKAYHLRTMIPNENTTALVKKWENHAPNTLLDLFNDYLFPIMTFSQKKKWDEKFNRQPFTKNDIDVFFGIEKNKNYPFAHHIYSLHPKANPFFVINEPFAEGENFFHMTKFYIEQIELLDILLDDKPIASISEVHKHYLKTNLKELEKTFKLIKTFYNEKVKDSNGYAYKLFKQAIFFYFNRFSSLLDTSMPEQRDIDSKITKKIFVWAMMIRADMTRLNQQTIKKYAIGEYNNNYSNNLAFFDIIANAINTDELLNLTIIIPNSDDLNCKDKYKESERQKFIISLSALLNDKYPTQDKGGDKND